MINQKVLNKKFPNKADQVAYAEICEARQIEYAEHLAKMIIPAELKTWENDMIKDRVATAIGYFSMLKGDSELTPEDLSELNQLKADAKIVTIGANCVRPIIALLICMWGEAVDFDGGSWPLEFDEEMIKRAYAWTVEFKLPKDVIFANKILAEG